jgi:hypothetical protein
MLGICVENRQVGEVAFILFLKIERSFKNFRLPEIGAGAEAAANDTRNRIVHARDRMRQVDLVNRKKLRVLQVALEESWDVARFLEVNQYKDEDEDEPDLVAARKEADGNRKKEDQEDSFNLCF